MTQSKQVMWSLRRDYLQRWGRAKGSQQGMLRAVIAAPRPKGQKEGVAPEPGKSKFIGKDHLRRDVAFDRRMQSVIQWSSKEGLNNSTFLPSSL